VNGSHCSNNPYINEPCVSVTVCSPDNSACQTINGILLDTGDIGLRLFKSALKVSLTPVTDTNGDIADCVPYADGSSNWGPVETASVILGNEPAVQVPIQVIDSTFGTVPTSCANVNQDPAGAGFNGSLGVGIYLQDCGLPCQSNPTNGQYYSCNGTNCNQAQVLVDNQVQNPVALLPHDNNGVIVELPSVPSTGALSANGALVLGISTQSNNQPTGVTAYDIDLQSGDFITAFDGSLYGSFIDSGSNGLYFPSPSGGQLPTCSPNPPLSDWFCPSSTKSLSATNFGAIGSPSGVVSFHIGNLISLLSSPNSVFANIGGPNPVEFDWGLPFFFGRKVYIGFETKTSSLGTGPYWAY
jgi:hypothetical protein